MRRALAQFVWPLFVWTLAASLSAPSAAAQSPNPVAPVSAGDQLIRDRLQKVFAQAPSLDAVEVTVRDGVVRLAGEAPTRDAHQQAKTIAEKTEGVVFVVDAVAEPHDLRRRLRPSLQRLTLLGQQALTLLPLLAIAALLIAAFWWLAGRVANLGVLERIPVNRLLQSVLRQILRLVVLLLGVFLALEVLDATALVGAILGAAGVVGLALGFAFRDLVENYLASIMLSLRHPFRVNDLVEVDGKLGSVVRMTLRDTVLMTPDGNHLTLPNATVFKSSVLNMTTNPLRRFVATLALAPTVDTAAVERAGLAILGELAGVAEQPAPIVRLAEFDGDGVRIQFFAWVDQRTSDYGKVASEAVRLINQAATARGFASPVATQRVLLLRERPANDESAPVSPTGTPRAESATVTKTASSASLTRAARRADVTQDHTIEKQIHRDRAQTEDEDLLNGDGGKRSGSGPQAKPTSTN